MVDGRIPVKRLQLVNMTCDEVMDIVRDIPLAELMQLAAL